MTLPTVPDGCDPAYHLFYVLMPDKATRDQVMERMRQEGINPTFHYVPLPQLGRRATVRGPGDRLPRHAPTSATG